jgi:hypothetical protein
MRRRLDIAAVGCLLSLGLAGCGEGPGESPEPQDTPVPAADQETAALHRTDPRGSYGAGIVLQRATAIDDILAAPAAYEGKIVQVSGTVREVCPRRGCWMEVASGDASLRVKVTDGEIVFPLSAKGSHAVVEGVLERIELTQEEHRAFKEHEAQERGVPFDPSSVSGPLIRWQLAGLGARIGG